jgi:hypothetical protein
MVEELGFKEFSLGDSANNNKRLDFLRRQLTPAWNQRLKANASSFSRKFLAQNPSIELALEIP